MTYQESNTLINKKPKVVSKITVSKGGVLNSNLSFSLENPPQGTPGDNFVYMDNWKLIKLKLRICMSRRKTGRDMLGVS